MSEFVIKVIRGRVQESLDQVKHYIEWGLDLYGSVEVAIRQERRTPKQNKKMWTMLRDISEKVTWYGEKLTPEQWKDLATASFYGCKVLPNLNNDGFVTVGVHTTGISKADMSAFFEYMYAFGAEHKVVWKEDTLKYNQDILDMSGIPRLRGS